MKKVIAVTTITIGLLTGSIAANAGNNCRHVKFSVGNGSGVLIKLKSVRYHNVSTGRLKTELFPNLRCGDNRLCTTPRGEHLRNGRNSRLDHFSFKFQYQDPNTGRWSSNKETRIFRANDPICIANKIYGGENWRITPDDLNRGYARFRPLRALP